MQPDGSYLWTGPKPNSDQCQFVCQEIGSNLLNRLRQGENLTLVVDIGNTPTRLDIASGTYTTTGILEGGLMGVPDYDRIDEFPLVSGTLRVNGSDGFCVGEPASN